MSVISASCLHLRGHDSKVFRRLKTDLIYLRNDDGYVFHETIALILLLLARFPHAFLFIQRWPLSLSLMWLCLNRTVVYDSGHVFLDGACVIHANILINYLTQYYFLGNFLKGLRCKQSDSGSHVAVTICWRLRSSAVFLVKSLHVTVTNSVADVMLLTGWLCFHLVHLSLGRLLRCVCVCVRVLPGKQKDLEILNPLWISDRPDIKAI